MWGFTHGGAQLAGLDTCILTCIHDMGFFNPKWSKSPSFLPALFGEVWGVTLFASLSVVSGVLIKACRVKTPSPGMSRRHLGCHLGLVSQECVSLILLCGPTPSTWLLLAFFFFFSTHNSITWATQTLVPSAAPFHSADELSRGAASL